MTTSYPIQFLDYTKPKRYARTEEDTETWGAITCKTQEQVEALVALGIGEPHWYVGDTVSDGAWELNDKGDLVYNTPAPSYYEWDSRGSTKEYYAQAKAAGLDVIYRDLDEDQAEMHAEEAEIRAGEPPEADI